VPDARLEALEALEQQVAALAARLSPEPLRALFFPHAEGSPPGSAGEGPPEPILLSAGRLTAQFCELAHQFEQALRQGVQQELDGYASSPLARLRPALPGLLEDLRQHSLLALRAFRGAAEQTQREASLTPRREDWLRDVVLPALDAYFRGEAARDRLWAELTPEERGDPWLTALARIYARMQRAMEQFLNAAQLQRFVAKVGRPPDPAYHHCLGTEASSTVAHGGVTRTQRDGYQTRGMLLRKAEVMVAE
jgi:hypothetical protein